MRRDHSSVAKFLACAILTCLGGLITSCQGCNSKNIPTPAGSSGKVAQITVQETQCYQPQANQYTMIDVYTYDPQTYSAVPWGSTYSSAQPGGVHQVALPVSGTFGFEVDIDAKNSPCCTNPATPTAALRYIQNQGTYQPSYVATPTFKACKP